MPETQPTASHVAKAWLADAKEREIRADYHGAIGSATICIATYGCIDDKPGEDRRLMCRAMDLRDDCIRRLAGTLPEGERDSATAGHVATIARLRRALHEAGVRIGDLAERLRSEQEALQCLAGQDEATAESEREPAPGELVARVTVCCHRCRRVETFAGDKGRTSDGTAWERGWQWFEDVELIPFERAHWTCPDCVPLVCGKPEE